MAHVAVTTTLPVLDCLWLEKTKEMWVPNQFDSTSLHFKRGLQPPFDFLNFLHKHNGTFETKHSFQTLQN